MSLSPRLSRIPSQSLAASAAWQLCHVTHFTSDVTRTWQATLSAIRRTPKFKFKLHIVVENPASKTCELPFKFQHCGHVVTNKLSLRLKSLFDALWHDSASAAPPEIHKPSVFNVLRTYPGTILDIVAIQPW